MYRGDKQGPQAYEFQDLVYHLNFILKIFFYYKVFLLRIVHRCNLMLMFVFFLL